MRGLTSREYDELVDQAKPCVGRSVDMSDEEERVAEALKARELLREPAECSCGHSHYWPTPLGHVAIQVYGAVRALEGGEK